jgi:phosphonate transport system substrate-binding protein
MMLTGCDQQEQTSQGPVYHETMDNRKPVYRLAIHPLHNPRKLTEAYQPLLDYLNSKMPDVHIELEASRDYQAYEAKFRERGPDLLLPNPWQTLEAIKATAYWQWPVMRRTSRGSLSCARTVASRVHRI